MKHKRDVCVSARRTQQEHWEEHREKLARTELSRAELMSMRSCVAGLEFMAD